MTEQERQGWHRPPTSRKFHWFIRSGAESLCRRYGFAFGAEFDPDTGNAVPGREDCRECFKKLRKRSQVQS